MLVIIALVLIASFASEGIGYQNAINSGCKPRTSEAR